MVKLRRKAIVVAWAICTVLFVGVLYFCSPPEASSCSVPEGVTLEMELVIVPYFLYNASNKALRERENEYITVLQKNLNHDYVGRIHVLTTNATKFRQRIEDLELSNMSKLLIVELKGIRMTRDVFDYISQKLVGVDVMFLNSDIYLGSGFDCVDPAVMRENKIMYALTRRAQREVMCWESDFCVEMKYIGSHDVFLFHLTEPIPQSALEHLHFLHPSLGMENIIIWIFKTKLKYCVLNPCSILEVFHLHCSGLRNYHHRNRVSNGSNTGMSEFTKTLVCRSR